MAERTIVLQYAVDPTRTQIEQLKSHVGAVRFAYNYGLDRVLANWSAVREGTESEYINSSAYSMRKLFNEEKGEVAPWWRQNNKEAYATGFANLQRGLQNFYKKRAGVPHFKAKVFGESDGIIFTTGPRRLDESRMFFTIPTIGKLKLQERASKLAYLLSHGGRIANVTARKKGVRWFLAINVRVIDELWEKYHLLRTKKDKKRVVGVDVGLKSAAVFSDGTVIENHRHYEKQLKKLRRLNKQLSRRRKLNKTTGEVASNRYEATRHELKKTYAKVTNQEVDFAHKLSKQLVDQFEVIGLEDLNVAGMVRNRKLSRRIAHASFGRIKQFVTYKSEWYKSKVVMIDRFYPSSKTCSECGIARAKLSLSERVFKCDNPICGNTMDRDLNAAVNIMKVAAQSCGEALNGHGDESAGLTLRSNETVVSEVSSQSLASSA